MIFHFHDQIFEILGNLVTDFRINSSKYLSTVIAGYQYFRNYDSFFLKFQHTKTPSKPAHHTYHVSLAILIFLSERKENVSYTDLKNSCLT